MAKSKKKGKQISADQIRKNKISSNANSGATKVKSNPFEMKITKQKHTILGRKAKHKTGLPGVSRSIANKKVSILSIVGKGLKNLPNFSLAS